MPDTRSKRLERKKTLRSFFRTLLAALLVVMLFLPTFGVADGNPVEVLIMYEDEQGGVISEDLLELLPGLTVYEANPAFVPPGYTLISAPTVNIIVTSTGKVSPQFIVFTYQSPQVASEAPVVPAENQPQTPMTPPVITPDIKVGDQIQFGRYEQDNNQGNGPEAIAWRVVQVQNNTALLVSVLNLDVQPYHNVNQPVTWESSAMRQWLNGSFYQTAFLTNEQELVLSTYVSNPANPHNGTYSGVDTHDQLFLLSVPEVQAMDVSLRQAANTAYANAKGGVNRQGYGTYWLRTAGSYEKNAAVVNAEGEIGYSGYYMRDKVYLVRPAFWLDFSKGLPQ